ncbi:NUDIX hydrolase [Mycobacterium sp. pUA109]|uniref:NrtR DNA-binding winged helix domain-containing protein n=1 Tax=Mycobacterium sp. pUA109 TaxID=3238982 RepID=UPI00351BDEE6
MTPGELSLTSVDVVALHFPVSEPRPAVAVAPRPWDPEEGTLALPGVLHGRGELLTESAQRALTAKLGAPPDAVRTVGQLRVFDAPHRDPRGPTLSIAMFAVLAPDWVHPAVTWIDLDHQPTLAFDHNRILHDTRVILADKLFHDLPFTRALLGDRFPVTRALAAAETLHGRPVDRGNFNRTLAATAGLARTGDTERARGTGRPASVWQWE